MVKRIYSTYLILTLIIVLGFILRILLINKISLYGDELTLVFDAYSLLKTGMDQTGQFLPLTFNMGAGRPGGYVYASIPFVALFGPSALGVRSLSIISGLLNIVLIYFLGKKFFSKSTGLIAAFIYSVSIWDLSLSIGGFEAHFALFLALLGIVLFIYATKKPFFYILSAFFLGLTIHTYPTYKLTLLFIIPLLLWLRGDFKLYFEKKLIVVTAISLLILTFLGILSASQTLFAGSENRFSNINVFNLKDVKEQIIQKINSERSTDLLPANLSNFFHNKPTEYFKLIFQSYFQNLSWDFLFFHGDKNPRHNMSNFGELYFAEAILIITGLYYGWSNYRRKTIFLIFWILIVPLPTALILEQHALRNSFMLPPLILFSSLGLVTLLNIKKWKYFSLGLVLLLFLVQFGFFIDKFYFLAPNLYSRFWSYPAKQASGIIIENKIKFDFIIVSDRIDNIEYAYPVYDIVDPKLIIYANQKASYLNNLKFKQINNIFIGNVPDNQAEQFIRSLKGSVLYIGSMNEQQTLPNFSYMNGLDGKRSLFISEKKE
ncbi:glycosyltransferase family 39 protein [Candidatus Daviesbacteria bacterium]|nr:glycosyltransferase family 39 protein [Candidatus Daviesbacteria bacterium]